MRCPRCGISRRELGKVMLNCRYPHLVRRAASSASTLALLLAGALPAMAQEAPAEGRETMGGEIVVTANKREQTLLEVPSSVLVVDGETLRERGVKTFLDMAQQTPGVIVSTSLVGGPTVQNFTIRGIGFDDFRPNGNPSAAVHFDGIYQGSSALIGGQMFDVQRVEILKGPQGTLYGRNTTAGAVNVISNKPSDRAEGFASLDYSSFNTVRGEAAVNVPLAETVALRVSGLYDRTDGYLTLLGANGAGGSTPAPGVIPGNTDPGRDDKTANSEFYGARALLSIGMDTGTEVLVNVHGFKDQGGQAQGQPTNGSAPAYSYYGNISPSRDRKNLGGSVTLTQDVGDTMLLTVLGGYEWMKSAFQWDDGSTARTYDIDYRDKVQQGSIEARLQNRDAGDINWTVGGAWFKDRIRLQSTLDGSDTFRTVFEANYLQQRESFAGFADVDAKIAPRLRVELGVRVSHERNRFSGYTHDLNPYGLSIGSIVFALPAEFDNKLSETSPSGRATVTYELSDDARVYASVGRGFRAGGFDGSTIWSTPEADAFKSERVWAYEGGVKFMPAHGPVQFEVAGFYYDFSNIQASSYRTYEGATTSVRTNVGKARSFGGEASFTVRPVRPMAINFGVALLDTKITAIDAITAAEQARLGNDLPFAPHMTLNGSVRYEFSLNDHMTLTPQVDARYVDTYYGDLDNAGVAGDFALVNARIDLKIDQRWTVAGFVRNLADVDYSTGGSSAQSFSGAPRTWGVSLGARF
jgi:iron complex outermembrane receptor protein